MHSEEEYRCLACHGIPFPYKLCVGTVVFHGISNDFKRFLAWFRVCMVIRNCVGGTVCGRIPSLSVTVVVNRVCRWNTGKIVRICSYCSLKVIMGGDCGRISMLPQGVVVVAVVSTIAFFHRFLFLFVMKKRKDKGTRSFFFFVRMCLCVG